MLQVLIGSIVSFLFTAARQSVNYPAMHVLLLILPVVAFMVKK